MSELRIIFERSISNLYIYIVVYSSFDTCWAVYCIDRWHQGSDTGAGIPTFRLAFTSHWCH